MKKLKKLFEIKVKRSSRRKLKKLLKKEVDFKDQMQIVVVIVAASVVIYILLVISLFKFPVGR